MSAELGQMGRSAAFAVVAAGICALVAAAQERWMAIFRDPVSAAMPLLFMATGAAAIGVGVKLAHPRAWARTAAVGVLLLLACAGGPWAIWLMFNGLFTALALLAPFTAFVAAVLLAVAWRDIGSAAALRALAEAETERLMREALAMDGEVPPPRRPWLLPAMYAVVGVPVALAGVAIFAPETWTWVTVRVEGVLAGRNPWESAFVASAKAYPYSGSPLAWYLDYEAKWVPLHEEDVLAVADGIAEEISWRLSAATGETDPVKAEAALWAAGRQKELPLWIASALRDRQVFYSAESLFSRSFDPNLHVYRDTVHLDCDQLVYVFLHVAWRLDLAMAAVPSPMHVYLRYGGPDGQDPLWVEATRFRHIDTQGGRVNYLGEGIGEDFFIDGDYYPSGRGGSWADAAVADAAGLYQPWTERDIRDSIVANVMAGVRREGLDAPYIDELEAHLDGTRELTLVSNLYGAWLERAKKARADGDLDAARTAALRARQIREEHGSLVIYNDREEDEILASIGG